MEPSTESSERSTHSGLSIAVHGRQKQSGWFGGRGVVQGGSMKAARILRFGPPSVIEIDDLPLPEPAAGQLLVRVKAAGVGNWDALIREGKFHQPLPLILGSELSGIVEAIGADAPGFKVGDEVYGATSRQWTGAHAEHALPSASMMALKPRTLNFVEAASAPIVS